MPRYRRQRANTEAQAEPAVEAEKPKHPRPGTRDERGNFIPGPGRPVGSRNKIASAFFDHLYALWQARGEEVLERVADTKPEAIVAAVVKLMPKEIDLVMRPGQELSDEELETAIANLRADLRVAGHEPAADGAGAPRDAEGVRGRGRASPRGSVH